VTEERAVKQLYTGDLTIRGRENWREHKVNLTLKLGLCSQRRITLSQRKERTQYSVSNLVVWHFNEYSMNLQEIRFCGNLTILQFF